MSHDVTAAQPTPRTKRVSYYEQPELWGNAPSNYQVQAQADIIQMIPPETTSILDAGCGDGIVTNALPQSMRVVGLDISEEALRYVRSQTVVGSITELPFEDRSFDLVMANDVVEHLPDAEYARALAEMCRVARRCILITVPHGEQLESRQALCAECGAVYHVHHHQRAFHEDDFYGLFQGEFPLREVRYSGATTLPPPDPTVAARHAMRFYDAWPEAVCGRCGSDRTVTPPADSLNLRCADAARASTWARHLHWQHSRSNRSELIGLFSREPIAFQLPPQPPGADRSVLEVDFANRLQAGDPGVSPGCSWARYVQPAGAERSAFGLQRAHGAAEPLTIEVFLPVVGSPGDRIELSARSPKAGDVLEVQVIDGVTHHRTTVGSAALAVPESTVMATIQHAVVPGTFGLALAVQLRGDICVTKLTYNRAGEADPVTRFVRLPMGHSVLATRDGGVIRSWGFLAAEEGSMPAPALDTGSSSHDVSPYGEVDLPDLSALADQAFAWEHGTRDQLSHELSRSERQRIAAERDRDVLKRRYLKQRKRMASDGAMAKSAAAGPGEHGAAAPVKVTPLRWLNRKARRLARRAIGPRDLMPQQPSFTRPWLPQVKLETFPGDAPRVLVLSHLFPHPEQPTCGPFVHEQLRALRRQFGVDARALVGRPFWMVHRPALSWNNMNPILLARLERAYRTLVAQQKNWNLGGVPVRYVPYRVLGPFPTHGVMYLEAMMRVIDRVRESFAFDLVHAHTSYLDGSAALAIARRFDVPLVITEHTGPFSILTKNPWVRRSTARSLCAASRIIAVSEAQRANVSALVPDSRQDRITVVPNGVDIHLFHPPDPPDSGVFNIAAPRLVYVGAHEPNKNLAMSLRAFARVRERFAGGGGAGDAGGGGEAGGGGPTLAIAGIGIAPGEQTDLTALIDELGLNGSVRLLGRCSRDEVAQLMRDECDLLLLSSWTETFGCVLTEALASGRPVIATRCGGPQDIVTDPILGELCPPGDPEAMAGAILRVIERLSSTDPAAIRAVAVSRFSYDTVAGAIHAIYQDVLQEARRA